MLNLTMQQDPVQASWLSLGLPFIGAVAGAALGPYLTARFTMRRRRREAFDRAIAAVRKAQLHRHYARDVPASLLDSDAHSAAQFNAELVRSGVQRFVTAMTDAREAMADLEPHFGPSFALADKWELTEDEADELIAELREARDL